MAGARSGRTSRRACPAHPLRVSQAPAGLEAEGLPSGRRTIGSGGSFLEVRVGQGRLDIVEFYSAGRSSRLVEALRGLGLVAERDFDSPCG